jgi:signal transduction histidine kinase/CheY-like chemotaxis protein
VFAAMQDCPGGLLKLTRQGVDYVAYVASFGYVGWKGAVLLPLDEVQEGARITIQNILLISVIGAFVMIFLAAAQTTLITKPIYRLMDRLRRVAGKDFTAFDNTPVERLPEIRNLNASVLAMIEQIRELINSSEQKTQEAQEQRDKAEESQKTAVRAQENAELAREAAEHASMAKSEFLFNMSHEIRTPLNAIIGMTDIGLHTANPEKKQHCLKKVDEASRHLLGIINDILDMSKIEANKLELAPVAFSFEKMLHRVVNVILFRVEEKKLDFHVRIDRNIPDMLIGDDQRLAQIIANLMSNAVKFTPEYGSVRLDARLEEEKVGICRIRIAVSDSGIGISEEQQARLFTSFQQAYNSTSRKFGGTGLGLAISKRLVEMMGGRIWIQSELNKGATFIFTTQLARGAEQQEQASCPAQHLAGLRVCALSASQELREYLQECLRKFGVVCDTFAGSEELLTRIRQNAPYALCFIDWQTLAPAGMDMVRRIQDANGAGTIVMMASALEWNAIEDEAAALGVQKMLSKPVFPSDILASLNGCFAAQDAVTADDASPATVESFQGRRVLLAEDNEINREIVLALLEPTGLIIECAINGREAVRMFSAAPDSYDLIFMDLQMPEMDGFTATRCIRALDIPSAKTIPIVAMTANVFSEDVAHCLEAGMTDHVGKPLEMRVVLEKLRRYLPERH